jgi:hypothetical protein
LVSTGSERNDSQEIVTSTQELTQEGKTWELNLQAHSISQFQESVIKISTCRCSPNVTFFLSSSEIDLESNGGRKACVIQISFFRMMRQRAEKLKKHLSMHEAPMHEARINKNLSSTKLAIRRQ